MRSALAVLLSLCLIALAPGLDGSRAAAAVVHSSAKAVRVAVGGYSHFGLGGSAASLSGSFGLTAVPTAMFGGGPAISLPDAAVKTAVLQPSAGLLSVESRQASPLAGLMRSLAAPMPEHGRMSAGLARSALDQDFLRRIGGRRLATVDDGQGQDPSFNEGGDGKGGPSLSRDSPKKEKIFVVPMVIIERLRKLETTDPEKAFEAAVEVFSDENETRYEVKITALRILEAMPNAKTLPVLLGFLNALHSPMFTIEQAPEYAAPLAAGASRWFSSLRGMFKSPLPQPAVTAAPDPTWALRRELIRALGVKAADAGELKPEIAAALKKSFADDRNVAVRLMAGWSLQKHGIDPGPELDPMTKKPVDRGVFRKKSVEDAIRDSQFPEPARPFKPGRLMVAIAGLAIFFGVMFTTLGEDRSGEPKQPVKTEQVDSLKKKQAADSLKAAAVADSIRLETMTPEQSLRELSKDIKELKDVVVGSNKKARQREAEGAGASGRLGSILRFLLVPALFVGMFFLFRGRMGGGAPGLGKTPKGASSDQGLLKKERFTDVAGIDETLIELQEIVDFVKNPAKYHRMGAKMPKGALLEGPPGTGKTLIAKAVAGEAGVNFFSMSGSEFVEMYVGVGAKRVRELFAKARASAPAIIFIDEIDAVGGKRGKTAVRDGGSDEKEATLNQLLTEIDGFNGADGLFVIGATNMKEKLDPALIRAGRLGRKIYVGMPEILGREAIAQLYAGRGVDGLGLRLSPDADLDYVARRTAGLAGANIEGIVNEAAILAVRRGSDVVENQDLDEAVDRDVIGATIHRNMSPELKRRIALHEAGHVLANLTSGNPGVPNKVTILPKGSGALGFAESGDSGGDKYLYVTSELWSRIDTAMGGLVVEEMFYGEWSTGPASDLEQANRLMRYMVEKLGMSAEIGFLQAGAGSSDPYGAALSEATKAKVDQEIKAGLKKSYERVKRRIGANKDKLSALAAALQEKETLTKETILEVVGKIEPEKP